ncbi:OadG family protein [Caproicibacter fermentans]|uniref:OadG family protein n=1 Tax=Caproicibacter fermentans TaxID=2576756 RepID=A0A7G8TCV4_9FIRM|nr:OadG family protein [Caproicibacter fermentans]QNK41445.1 OadG family protein [Caproicibacter fermentans]
MNFQQEVQISLTVLITGLVVVFLMLIFLTLVIKGYGKAVNSLQSKLNQRPRESMPVPKPEPVPAAAPAPSEPAAEEAPAAEEGISEEILAVLAAAAYSMIPGGVVTSVRRAAVQSRAKSSWGMAGLLENTRPF